jgi:hypothetical protein
MITANDIGQITTEKKLIDNDEHKGFLYKYSYVHVIGEMGFPCYTGSLHPLDISVVKNMFMHSINKRINGEI